MRLPTRGVIAFASTGERPGPRKHTTFASKQERHPTFSFGQIAPERLFAMTAIDSTTLEAGGWTSLFWPNDNFPTRRVFKVNGRLARQSEREREIRDFRRGENAEENLQSHPNGVLASDA
jgi:hypothetical protein